MRLSTTNVLLLDALDLSFCNIFNQTSTSLNRKHFLDVKVSRLLGIPLYAGCTLSLLGIPLYAGCTLSLLSIPLYAGCTLSLLSNAYYYHHLTVSAVQNCLTLMYILLNLQLREIRLLICSFYKTQNSFSGFIRDIFWLLFVRQANSVPHFNANSPRSFITPSASRSP